MWWQPAVLLPLLLVPSLGRAETGLQASADAQPEALLQFEAGCAALAQGDARTPQVAAGVAEAIAEVCERLRAARPTAEGGSSLPRRAAAETWYADPDIYFVVFLVLGGVAIGIAIYFSESCLWGTSLCCRSRTQDALRVLGEDFKHMRLELTELPQGTRHGFSHLFRRHEGDGEHDKHEASQEKPVFGATERDHFWTEMARSAKTAFSVLAPGMSSEERRACQISFSRNAFAGYEAVGAAQVDVKRTGSLQGRVVVRIRTATDLRSASFQALAGADYEPLDDLLTFEEGEAAKSVEVRLLQTDATWSPTRWFRIELVEVISGDASIGGPTVATTRCPCGVAVRIFIVQDDTFPNGIPQEYLDAPDSHMVVLLYYFRERIRARKMHFWYTLAGLLYAQVHNVVVTPVVLYFVLNWATDPAHGGSYDNIVILGSVQFLSYLLYRWGDLAQLRHRGRTGGTRMVHRHQLLSKLLMMDQQEQFEFPGEHWFYAGLINVDSVTVSGYWQMYAMMQNIFGLLLVVGVLIWKALDKAADVSYINMLPTATFLIVTPTAVLWIMLRRGKLTELLEQRMDSEEKWVEILAWASGNGKYLYAFGVREIAKVDEMFSMAMVEFSKRHMAARDYANDSQWVMRWFGSASYCLILCWAAFRLLHARTAESDTFSVADCVLLIQLFDRFGKYLVKVSDSFVAMQKASVSLKRICNLLSLPEQRALTERTKALDAGGISKVSPVEDDVADEHIGDADRIIFNNVSLEVPERPDGTGLGPIASIGLSAGLRFSIPFGKVVFITGGTEGERLSVLSLAAKVLRPTSGEVSVPPSEWSVIVPQTPAFMPFCKINEDYIICGASSRAAVNMALTCGMDPDTVHARLPPGKAVVHNLARALLRDPMVLFAVRPISSAPPEFRNNVLNVLLAWQSCGGGKMLVRHLDGGPHDLAVPHPDEAPAPFGPPSNHRRTLVISGETPPEWLPAERFVEISLDALCEDEGVTDYHHI